MTLILLLGLLVGSCEQVSSDTVPFKVAESEVQFLKASSSRYEIEAWEGYGVPGSPTANIKLENARSVLQAIINECALGTSTLIEGTDGVITLHPEVNYLSTVQIACVRSYEQPGLLFRDKKAN